MANLKLTPCFPQDFCPFTTKHSTVLHSPIPSSPPIYPLLPFPLPSLVSSILCFWCFTSLPLSTMLERDSFYASKSWSWIVLSSALLLDGYRKMYTYCVCFVSPQNPFSVDIANVIVSMFWNCPKICYNKQVTFQIISSQLTTKLFFFHAVLFKWQWHVAFESWKTDMLI